MAQSGVESIRTNLYWDATEPAPNQFYWADNDKLVLAAAAHGLSLLPIVEFTPKWASSEPTSTDYDRYAPTNPATFANFMTALVQRYGPNGTLWDYYPSLRRYAVQNWQIWDEPAGNYDWRSQPWSTTYTQLLRAAYTAIHTADPTAQVVTGAVVGLGGSHFLTPWNEARQLYKLGARSYFDVMAFNGYTYSPSVTASAHREVLIAKKLRAVMRHYGDAHKPIWLTEFGWPAAKHKIPKRDYLGFETTARGQLKRMRAYYEYVAKHRPEGIARSFWYTWATSYNATNTLGALPTFAFSGLEQWIPGHPFQPLPILSAYRRTAAKFEGCYKSTIATNCA